MVNFRAGLWLSVNGFGPSVHYQWCLLLVYTASCDCSSISLCFFPTLGIFLGSIYISYFHIALITVPVRNASREEGVILALSLRGSACHVLCSWRWVCRSGFSHCGRPGSRESVQEPGVPTIHEGPCPVTYLHKIALTSASTTSFLKFTINWGTKARTVPV